MCKHHHQPQDTESWEKKFDEEFNNGNDSLWKRSQALRAETTCGEEIKSFIRDLLEKTREEAKREGVASLLEEIQKAKNWPEAKEFIKQTRTQTTDEIMGMVEGMRKSDNPFGRGIEHDINCHCERCLPDLMNSGYNQALSDLIKQLNSLKNQ